MGRADYLVKACMGLLALVFAAAIPVEASAKIFYSREGAFKLAFPKADKVRRKHLFVKGDQRTLIERSCRCRAPAKLLTVYVGERQGSVLGYAYIDTHRVRTLPETFMVVIDPRGKVSAVHILAFHEPPEYMPRPGWLARLKGRRARVGGGKPLAGIAGATLSATAINTAVRKILTTHAVLRVAPVTPKAGQKVARGR